MSSVSHAPSISGEISSLGANGAGSEALVEEETVIVEEKKTPEGDGVASDELTNRDHPEDPVEPPASEESRCYSVTNSHY